MCVWHVYTVYFYAPLHHSQLETSLAGWKHVYIIKANSKDGPLGQIIKIPFAFPIISYGQNALFHWRFHLLKIPSCPNTRFSDDKKSCPISDGSKTCLNIRIHGTFAILVHQHLSQPWKPQICDEARATRSCNFGKASWWFLPRTRGH